MLPQLFSVLAQWGNDGHMDLDAGAFRVMMAFMSLFWFGFLAVIAWAVLAWSRRPHGWQDESALEIARKRLARGEITAEEFERIKRTIT